MLKSNRMVKSDGQEVPILAAKVGWEPLS